MYDIEELKKGIENVARHWEVEALDRSPFHLSACGGCGAPSFQQPCPLCRYYPRGSDKGYYHPEVATKQMFCTMVDKSGPGGADGTIATWLIKNNERRFHNQERAIASAHKVDVPSASDYWDAVVDDGHSLGRYPSSQATYAGWRGMFELQAVLTGQYHPADANPRLTDPLKKVVNEWVAAAHSDDHEEMKAAVAEGSRIAAEGLTGSRSNGNLRAAIRHFDDVERLLSAAPAP